MSGREWKPGDVAWLTGSHGGREIGYFDGEQWCYSHGARGVLGGPWIKEAHPLAVVDPESFGAVADLMNRITPHFLEEGATSPPPGYATRINDATRSLRDGLREIADPPPVKPDEPTGLGAVVEDSEGQRLVRWKARGRADRCWKGEESGDYRAWCDINAVRVLSEGVTP